MRATIFLPLIPPLLVRPHRLFPSTAGRTIALRLFEAETPHGALRVLALVGFLVGTLVLAMQGILVTSPPPDVARTVARATTSQPLAIAFRSGVSPVSPILSHPGENHAAVLARRVSSARDRLALDVEDLDDDDDDPSSMRVLTSGERNLPPVPVVMSVTDVTYACQRPSRYLARPQLLTRL
jgi:hypothetical protein